MLQHLDSDFSIQNYEINLYLNHSYTHPAKQTKSQRCF